MRTFILAAVLASALGASVPVESFGADGHGQAPSPNRLGANGHGIAPATGFGAAGHGLAPATGFGAAGHGLAPVKSEPVKPAEEQDFYCGEEIEYLCPNVPRDEIRQCLSEHRKQLGLSCYAHVIEHEAFKCGMQVEYDCGSTRNSTDPEAFHKCVEAHKEELEKICPEHVSPFEDYDKVENIKCGVEFEEYCLASCKENSEKKCEYCIHELEHKSKACNRAFREEDDFECGIDVQLECGGARKLGPSEFVHCIVEKKLCSFKV